MACSLPASDALNGLGSSRTINSFMGVHFGDSIDSVERRFPDGGRQISPYGAPAYQLEDVSSQAIDYSAVTYEFSDTLGMQMVYAIFAPSQGADVYQHFESTLGAPSSTDATGEGTARSNATWQLPGGGRVMFAGRIHRLALLGKDAGSLKEDLTPRDLDISESP